MKSPKADDLKFQPEIAFDRLRRLAREVLAVPKKELTEKKSKAPRAALNKHR